MAWGESDVRGGNVLRRGERFGLKSVGVQAAEQVVSFAVRAGGEIKRVVDPPLPRPLPNVIAQSPSMTVARPLGSHTFEMNLLPGRIVRVDMAVAEISDP